MLRVTVDINGRQIGKVAAVRVTQNQSPNTYEVYDVTGVRPTQSVVEQGTQLTTVEHYYEDGASVLVQKMMEKIDSLD